MRSVALLLAVLTAACCDQRRVTYEIVDGEPFAEYQWEQVQGHIADGWNCNAETIRNAFGARIGERWTCERC